MTPAGEASVDAESAFELRAPARRASPALRRTDGDGWLRDLGLDHGDDSGIAGSTRGSTDKAELGGWELLWDVGADLPHLLQGPGLDLATVPGPEDLPSGDGDVDWGRARLEPRLRVFLGRVPQISWWRGESVRWNDRRSWRVGDAWLVEFEQVHRGVPVEGARAIFRLVSGRIIQFGLEGLTPVERSTRPELSWRQARLRAAHELKLPIDLVPTEAELVLAPAPMDGSGPAHRLLWRTFFPGADAGTLRLAVDGDTGSIVELRPARLSGEVWGEVHRAVEAPAESTPLPWLEVWNDGVRVTDADGRFDDVPGTSIAALRGPYAEVRDLCGSVELASDSGRLDFGGATGTDCTTPGLGGAGNTQAARDAFYHLARGTEQVLAIQPGATLFLPLAAFTNTLESPCSASWDPGAEAMFFGRSSDECNNPGEVPGLIAHEFGHALDGGFRGLSSFGGSNEAAADVVALLYTEDGCVARGLRPGIPCHNCSPTCSGIRDLDRFSAAFGVAARPESLTDPAELACGRYGCPFSDDPSRTGPLGFQAHCESHLASTAIRDLIDIQARAFGEEQAWLDVRRLWFRGMPALGDPYRRVPSAPQCSASVEAIDGCAIDSWYHVLLAMDDDDGDLRNGTPNACRIWEAFALHGLACGESKNCTCQTGLSRADPGPDRSICRGDTVTLGTPALDGTLYLWDPTGETTAQIDVTPLETTTFRLHASNACGRSEAEVVVTVRDCELDGSFDGGGVDWWRSGAWRPVASPLCAPPHPDSSPAMYFGHLPTCRLGSGGTEFGDLISPQIAVGADPGALAFSYYLQVDDPRPDRDRAELAISVAGGPFIPRWAATSADPQPGAWQESPMLSLAPYADQPIRLRFRFDSVDALHNDGYGWLVDQVHLVAEAAPEPNGAPEIVRLETPPPVQSECACLRCLFQAVDAADGDLSHLIHWHSSLDGALGVGGRLRTILSPGQHILTVSVVDYGGAATSESLTLTIVPDAESCELDEWPPAEPRLYCGDDEDIDP